MTQIDLPHLLLWCLAAFLSGSIPFGLIVVKLAGKGDVRKSGSGNIGATNVMRAGGKALGIATLALDVAKGYLPVFAASHLGLPAHLLAFVALAAVLGHMFTPWLRFKGGKGVATALGVALAYHAPMVLPSLAAFLLLVVVFRFVSLGSVVAALVLVPAAAGVFGSWFCLQAPEQFDSLPVVAWTLIAFLVIERHKANIQRLLKGTESKLGGGKKAAKDA
ncbi:MAG TPA: glycerol-3-phosphate 1-O-acyltransferase PlsY [Holophaga sp.]|nr:glycerol-3-phosphate 1-O-acyltransferase PlsY [Holophaga sp.]